MQNSKGVLNFESKYHGCSINNRIEVVISSNKVINPIVAIISSILGLIWRIDMIDAACQQRSRMFAKERVK